MLRRCLFGGLGLLMLASAVVTAKPGIVKTKDGQTYQGDVRSDDNAVYIKNKGVEMRLDKRNVESVTDVADPHQQFLDSLAKLEKNDVDGRIALARQAYNNQQYKDARDALDQALAIDPNNRAASDLQTIVQKQMALEKGAAPAPGPAEPGPAQPVGATPRTGDEPKKLLSASDINIIRQLEWSNDDKNVRVRLKGDVKKRFVDYKAVDPRQFNAMSVTDQGWEILREGTQEMRKDVELMTDPRAIAEFRRPQIYTKIMAGCATSGCHGTAGAAGFQLLDGANDAVVYTNFYILQKYSKSVGGRVYAMIDRQSPGDSLLLQAGLPPDLAEVKHPAVGTYNGIFKNKADPTYRALEQWMSKTLSIVVPDYGIEYSIPGAPQQQVKPAAPANNAQPGAAPQQGQPSGQPPAAPNQGTKTGGQQPALPR